MSTPNPASFPAGPSRILPTIASPSVASPIPALAVSEASRTSARPSARPAPYRPGTFRSLAPVVDEILEDVRAIAEGRLEGVDGVVDKAKEVLAALKEMRATALALPGGDMSTDELEAVERELARRADERRETLRRFAAAATPTIDAVPPAADATVSA
ncbi:hypothetical protein Q5752_001314 [Cryptotrichosporon argae]